MTPNTDKPVDSHDEFLASNAVFFAHSFVALNDIFQSSGPMNIISEETKRTVAVGVKEADNDGSMDVNCVLLKANQESLYECINTLSSENEDVFSK